MVTIEFWFICGSCGHAASLIVRQPTLRQALYEYGVLAHEIQFCPVCTFREILANASIHER